MYTDGLLKNSSVFSVGDQTAVGVWTPQCSISPTGNMTTNGTLTSAEIITCGAISVTGSSTSASLIPTVAGIHGNNYGGYAFLI